jgi:hypothetical protein
MFTKTQIITPKQAQEWLDTKNLHNRPLSQVTVNKYAQEMKAGRWKLNGEAIIFGISGNLMNGQHRLAACVKANSPFETTVTLGVKDEYFDTLDDNKPRNLADVLSIDGHTYGKYLSSALFFIHDYAMNRMKRDKMAQGRKPSTIPTKQVLERLLESQSGISNSCRYYVALKGRPGGVLLPPSLCIGLHYIFSLINEEKATTFFDQFQSGLNIEAGNPIGILRQRLIAGGRDVASKLRTDAQYFYTVMAWNAFASDKPMKRQSIAYKAGDELPEINDVPRSLMKDLL